MRNWVRLCAAVAVAALTLTGCARVVTGVATPDPRPPGTAVSEDGYGIIVGHADAPIQLALFTEPQCDHCANFQAAYGEELKAHITAGRLAVVYRVLTFFDDAWDTDYSAQVANALFLSVTPATTADTFQGFVEALWANQDLSETDFTVDDLADLAADAGVNPGQVAAIRAGRDGVDTAAMDAANAELLDEANPDGPGTPTVYDLEREVVVDISDPNWLSALMRRA